MNVLCVFKRNKNLVLIKIYVKNYCMYMSDMVLLVERSMYFKHCPHLQ